MDFDAMAYPDTFEIGGVSYKGVRDRKKSEVLVPYTQTPTVDIGDTIVQRTGPSSIQLKVVDVSFLEDGSLNVGTQHPHMLTLHVENLTAARHTTAASPSINIGTLSGQQVQVGNQNSMAVHISLSEVVRQVSESGDPKAKSLLRALLENNTVAAIVGAGVSALIGALGA
jgi:hypothetical protein